MTAPTTSSSSSSTSVGPGAAPELAKVRVRIGLMEVESNGRIIRRLTNFEWEGVFDLLAANPAAELGQKLFAALQTAPDVAPSFPDVATITAPARKLLLELAQHARTQATDTAALPIVGAGRASVVRSLEARGIVMSLHGHVAIAPEAREWVEQAITSWERGGGK